METYNGNVTGPNRPETNWFIYILLVFSILVALIQCSKARAVVFRQPYQIIESTSFGEYITWTFTDSNTIYIDSPDEGFEYPCCWSESGGFLTIEMPDLLWPTTEVYEYHVIDFSNGKLLLVSQLKHYVISIPYKPEDIDDNDVFLLELVESNNGLD